MNENVVVGDRWRWDTQSGALATAEKIDLHQTDPAGDILRSLHLVSLAIVSPGLVGGAKDFDHGDNPAPLRIDDLEVALFAHGSGQDRRVRSGCRGHRGSHRGWFAVNDPHVGPAKD